MNHDVTAALVPIKDPDGAKLRLAGTLRRTERRSLADSMAGHVVETLQRYGLNVVPVRGPGLNEAVESALHRTGLPALVVMADLPWLAPDDVARFLSENADVVVARGRDGGTGALLLRRFVRPAFGPHSALRHAAAARAAGSRVRVVDIAGFARDVDDAPSLVSARTSPALQSSGAGASPRRHLRDPGGPICL